jgi:hypothetical protein
MKVVDAIHGYNPADCCGYLTIKLSAHNDLPPITVKISVPDIVSAEIGNEHLTVARISSAMKKWYFSVEEEE